MVKVVLIAIIKIYVGISAIEASAKVKKSLQSVSNPQHTSESTYTDCSARPTPVAITKLLNGTTCGALAGRLLMALKHLLLHCFVPLLVQVSKYVTEKT